ncbi:MAG: cytochrome c oxidase subunit II [Planctomycetia bacterium]|jgi:cytochrome c oxidase subunit 2|nr:cytochrome c oxidase subunit II [Planctomycetia bacterium]
MKRFAAVFWSLLFLSVPVLGVATFIVGPAYDIWLPRDVSEHGAAVDGLFYFILALTGVVFIATEMVLFWFIWKYDESKSNGPGRYVHGSHTLEVVWTIIPAAVLLFLAIYQMNTWADVKMRRPNMTPTVEVVGRQFEWRLRYPGRDGMLGTPDDLHLVNDLHLPIDEDILIQLKSMDVLHSFFLPNVRIKQDAVPGMKIPVWFKAREEGVFDIVCAELCGWGHYKMKGRVTFEPREAFERWLERKYAEQEATQPRDSEMAMASGVASHPTQIAKNQP